MKKFILIGLLLVAVISCSKEKQKLETPRFCSPCGTYVGTFDADLEIPLVGIDTALYNLPTQVVISEGENDSLNFTLDFSSFYGMTNDTFLLSFRQTYWTDTTIQDREFVYNSAAIITNLEVTSVDNFDSFQGVITLSGDASGTVNFEVSR